jgi:hypothetical protein
MGTDRFSIFSLINTCFVESDSFIRFVSQETQSATMTNKAELSRFLFQDEAPERDFGQILSVSGPVVIAEKMTGAAMYELVSVPRRGSGPSLQGFFFFFFFFTRDVTGACGHVGPRRRDHSS